MPAGARRDIGTSRRSGCWRPCGRAGATHEEIAAALPGRTPLAVERRIQRLGLARKRRPSQPKPAPDGVVTTPEYVLIVRHGGWELAINRGDRSDMERCMASMLAKDAGMALRVEEVTE